MKASSTAYVGLAAALTLVAVAGCSSPTPEEARTPLPDQVIIADRAYSPSEITIDVGDTVTWVFDDGGMVHDVVADDKSFRSPLKAAGSFTHTFDEPGTFTYHCTPHPDMTGTVVVE